VDADTIFHDLDLSKSITSNDGIGVFFTEFLTRGLDFLVGTSFKIGTAGLENSTGTVRICGLGSPEKHDGEN